MTVGYLVRQSQLRQNPPSIRAQKGMLIRGKDYMESVLTKKQVKTFGPKKFRENDRNYQITAEVQYDDECGNGHNTFAITGVIHLCDVRGNPVRWDSAGCLHEDIAKHIPELAPFIKWHLFDSTGPMHYIANVLYLAGNRDCYGKAAGEPSSFETAIQFADFPIKWRSRDHAFMKWMETAEGADFEVIRIDHEKSAGESYNYGPKYTLGGAPDKWYQCPFDTAGEALEFLAAMRLGYKVVKTPSAFSTGKARELDLARSAAVWPDATDEELSVPPEELKAKLEARLPGLLAEFRAAVESLGFVY
jgi:hypothetical protein